MAYTSLIDVLRIVKLTERNLHWLFVCSGNICRSPTAERLARAYAEELGIENFSASSAGTNALVGRGVHLEASRIIAQFGGQADGFTARQLTERIIRPADLIICMATEHRDRVLELSPDKLHKCFTLVEATLLITEFGAASVSELSELRFNVSSRANLDILDPIGRAPEVFDAVGRQIAELLTPLVDVIRPPAPPLPA